MIKNLLILLIIASTVCAQAPNKNWEKVIELDDQYVFVDTSNIKQIEKQISAIGLSIYKTPVANNPSKKETFAVKTNIVFDTESKKYTIIGTLYYDKLWKIIGESSTPGRSINTALFGMLIDSSKVVSSIYNRSVAYLAKYSELQKEIKQKSNTNDKKPISKNVQPLKDKNDTVATPKPTRDNLTEKFIDKKLSEEFKPQPDIKPAQNKPIVNNPEKTKVTGEYDINSDKNVRGTIFTDGNKYCFQVSSWKEKSQAELELKRLISAGHNAFIVEAYLPQKGGNWYRVRIGYFNSAQDADQYRRKMR